LAFLDGARRPFWRICGHVCAKKAFVTLNLLETLAPRARRADSTAARRQRDFASRI